MQFFLFITLFTLFVNHYNCVYEDAKCVNDVTY